MERLPAIAVEVEAHGWESVVEQGEALTDLIREFRNDHVVHRSSKNPRGTRGLEVHPDGARVSAGGIMYPREGEEPTVVTSETPETLLVALEAYVLAVLDMLEPFAPPRHAGLPSLGEIEELLEREG
jgi:hypothetical protein